MREDGEKLDPAAFRRAMRGLAGSVTVITCGEPGGRKGLTATAVCSVTDDPPTLLACVNSSASAHPLIRSTRRFAVNVLAEAHTPVASRFAGRAGADGEERFAEGGWVRMPGGAPMLADAVASFDCAVEAEHRHGTHSIFIGRVLAVASRNENTPLLYLAGRFGVFAETSMPR